MSAQALPSEDGALEPGPTSGAEERQRLIMAGIGEMAEKDTVEPRVSDIVRRAGLSNKTFYRHFDSKDELLASILDQALSLQSTNLQARLSTEAQALNRVRVWVREVLALAVQPDLAAMTRPLVVHQARLFSTLGPEFWKSVDTVKVQLRDAITDAERSGEIEHADPAADADAIYHLAIGWLHSRVVERLPTTADDVERIVDFAIRGLRRS